MDNIYENRTTTAAGVKLSMVRSYRDMHTRTPSTGAIAYQMPDGSWSDDIWTGAASAAGDMLRLMEAELLAGASIDQVIDVIVDNNL